MGLDDGPRAARKSGALDYDAPIEGLQALDRYTLRIRFKQPGLRIPVVAHDVEFAAVAREVVEKYKDERSRVMEQPGGHRGLPC